MGPWEPPGQGDPITRGPLRAPWRERQGDPIISPPLRLEEGSQGDPIIPSPFDPPANLLRGDPLGRGAFGAAELLLLLLLLLPPPAVSSCRPSAILLICCCTKGPIPLIRISRGPAAILPVTICNPWILSAIAPMFCLPVKI